MLEDLEMYVRFASGLPRHLRRRVTREQALREVEQGLRDRERSFLGLLRRAVYGFSTSPYLKLLRHAGCEYGDLEADVRRLGLEGALAALHARGVYVSFEEFKGRTPIVRGSLRFEVDPRAFDNPFTQRAYEGTSGGSTGTAVRVGIDLDHLAARAGVMLLLNDAHGITGKPTAMWRGTLPDGMGISYLLKGALIGHTPERWFTPVSEADLRPSLKYRYADRVLVGLGRVLGHAFPRPEPLPLERAEVLATWAADAVRREGRATVRCNVSKAVRVCLAAAERGLDLSGVSFVGGGEPATEGKLAAIHRVGARLVPVYAMTEMGQVAIGCGDPADPTDVHLLEHFVALHRVTLQLRHGASVPAFCLTALVPSTTKVVLNFLTDDFGDLSRRRCGCPFGALGLDGHLSRIFSYRKLVGEAVTLVGCDVERVLEQVLPARFGGSPQDWQLREEEDADGLTRLTLVVRPGIGLPDEREVVGAFLEAIGRNGPIGDVARATWSQARGVRLVREEPSWTSRGKLLPLALSRGRKPQAGG